MTGLQVHNHSEVTNRLLRQRRSRGCGHGRRRQGRRWHGDVPSATTGSLLDTGQIFGRARAEEGKQAEESARVSSARAQTGEKFQPTPSFYRPGTAPRELNSSTVKRPINGHISKKPAGPLRARAAFLPSYDRLRHQLTKSNWSLGGQMLGRRRNTPSLGTPQYRRVKDWRARRPKERPRIRVKTQAPLSLGRARA
jgi:hypothetical protein